MLRQAFRFGLVGALATLVHMVIGTILIQFEWHPLIANAVAFCTAFTVSFIGHLGYSFADQEPGLASALWRFALVALAGFSCNEILLTLLLKMQMLPDTAALWVSTASAAILTFGLSKSWAFRQRTQDSIAASDSAYPGDHR